MSYLPRRAERAIAILRQRGPIALSAASVRFIADKLDMISLRSTTGMPFVSVVGEVGNNELRFFDATSSDLTKHYRVLESWEKEQNKEVSSINWFLPDFINPYGGGHYNIFRFANMFSMNGIFNRFIIYSAAPDVDVKSKFLKIRNMFPSLKFDLILAPSDKDKYDVETWVPYADLTFATTWQSAYYVMKFNKTKGKYYFIQDFEPYFYPAGTFFALAENTYKWRIPAITFGQWLSYLYSKNYNCIAQDFIPCADPKIFKPIIKSPREEVKRIFFFARPISERRAFEIGIFTLEKIMKKYPSLEIVMAGSVGINLNQYSIRFPFEDLGSLTLEETAKLYQSCDIGLCFSITNLSFLPLELMASGCLTITNCGPTVEWLLNDGSNCLLADPLPSSLAHKFDLAVGNYELRKRLFDNGLRTINSTSWENEFERVRNFILTGEYQKPIHISQDQANMCRFSTIRTKMDIII